MRRQVYKIITPQGKKIKCTNLAAFAKRHSFPIDNIYPGVRRPIKRQGFSNALFTFLVVFRFIYHLEFRIDDSRIFLGAYFSKF